jgi:transcriptional regulator with PAS, ATPase and Fis domain
LKLQPRLLRVLDSRTVRRLGDTRDYPIDVRVVAATHRNLPKMVRAGDFRQDLFFRLSVVEIEIPPLRNRMDDLEPLIRHFLASQAWTPSADMEGDNLELLRAYHWPGNVRELRNAIERAVSLANQPGLTFDELQFDIGHAGLEVTAPQINFNLPFKEAKAAAVERFEAEYLAVLMKGSGNNLSRAARSAELDRGYLRNLLRRHGLLSRAPAGQTEDPQELEPLGDKDVTQPGGIERPKKPSK